MFPLAHRLFLLSGCLLWLGGAGLFAGAEGGDQEHFLIEGAAPADRGNGVVLNLGSATLRGGELELHLGFRNMGVETIPSYGELSAPDFHLGHRDSFSETVATKISPALERISPKGGIPPRLANAGIAVFADPGSRDNLQLRVSGFPPIPFSLSEDQRFQPPGAREKISTVAPLSGRPLLSNHKDLGIFNLHVSGIRLDEEYLVVDLEFENASNRGFILDTSGTSGGDAYFIDGNFQMHSPAVVSPSLSSSIGPIEKQWEAGARNGGSLSFKRSHPHAMRRILFSFPTYESIVLTLDEKTRTYSTQVIAPRNPGASAEPSPLRLSNDLFKELSAQLASASTALQAREVIQYLDHFSPESQARGNQADFVTGLNKVSADRVEFSIVKDQLIELSDDGRIDDVQTTFDYVLSLPGADHRFRSHVNLGFSKGPSGEKWMIDRMRFTRKPPFWLAGLTQHDSMGHFSVYSRPGAFSATQLARSGEQLEAAYEALALNKGFPLASSYIAFLVDRVEDFEFLTQMDPLRYHGAASTSYAVEDDKFVAVNQAIFINEFAFKGEPPSGDEHSRDKTMTHELVHLALSGSTRHFTPPWLTEGIAIYLAGQLNAGSRRAILEAGGLPILSLSAMSRGGLSGSLLRSQAVLNFEYIYAGEAVAYLIRTYGTKRFFEYYDSFANITPSQLDALALEQTISTQGGEASLPKLMHQITLELTRRQFGISLYDLDTVVRSHVSLQPR